MMENNPEGEFHSKYIQGRFYHYDHDLFFCYIHYVYNILLYYFTTMYTVRRYKFSISRERGRLVRILPNRRLACLEK